MYVPSLRFNLLSVKKLATNGICVTFNRNIAVIKKDGQVLGVATLKDDLYQFVVKVEDKEKESLSQLVKEKEPVMKADTKIVFGHEASGGSRRGRIILHAQKFDYPDLPNRYKLKPDHFNRESWARKHSEKYFGRLNYKERKKFLVAIDVGLPQLSGGIGV